MWRSRRHNIAADVLCNVALANDCSVHEANVELFQAVYAQKGCLRMHSDVGYRDGRGAVGFTIVGWLQNDYGRWCRHSIGRGCSIVEGCRESWQAECAALQLVVREVMELMVHKSGLETDHSFARTE